MKPLLKFLLKYYLKAISKLVLLFHRPFIIAIAGSTNKTFVKEEIYKHLTALNLNVSTSHKSFNTEIGLPLAILNISSGYGFYKLWPKVIIDSLKALFKNKFPKIIILELGVSDAGDMKYLLSIIKPNITIVTDITKRYLEGFADMGSLVYEYEYLAKNLARTGIFILNYDNIKVRQLASSSQAKVIYFSLATESIALDNLWQAIDITNEPTGQKFKIKHNNQIANFNIPRFGQHHIYCSIIAQIVQNHLKENNQ